MRNVLALTALAAAFAGLTCATVAWASLGAGWASIEVDRTHFSARMERASAATGAYSVNTLTLQNGGVAKEFALNDGTVFAVAWQGPSRPDLRQLLGARFAAFQEDSARLPGAIMRRPLNSNRSDLVVHSAGRPGGFWGFAYIPQLLPAGFSAADLL